MFTSTYSGEGSGVGIGNTGAGSWGFIIFFIIILWFFFRDNKEDYCHQDLRADSIGNTAKLEYNNLVEQRNAKEQIMQQATLIRNEQQAETIFDLKINAQTQELKNGQLLLAKDGEIRELHNQINNLGMFNQINRKLDKIECEMLPKPPVYGQGVVTTATPVPFTYGGGCGYNNGFCV